MKKQVTTFLYLIAIGMITFVAPTAFADTEVITISAYSITDESVTLRGRLIDGRDNTDVWFALRENRSPSCSSDDYRYDAGSSPVDEGDYFTVSIDGLDNDSEYHYRACAERGSDDDSGEVKEFTTRDTIFTLPRVTTSTLTIPENDSVVVCGKLVDNGKYSDTKVWFNIREYSPVVDRITPKTSTDEGDYCTLIDGLEPASRIRYSMCAQNLSGTRCGTTRTVSTKALPVTPSPAPVTPPTQVQPQTTNPATQVATATIVTTTKPTAMTLNPVQINPNYAKLSGYYVSHGSNTSVWYEYGITDNLGKTTEVQEKGATQGSYLQSLPYLKGNQTYYYRAVAKNQYGTSYGDTYSFTTPSVVVISAKTETPTSTVVPLVKPLPTLKPITNSTALSSYVALDIDNKTSTVTEFQEVNYEITWKNLSTTALSDVELKVTIPDDVQITRVSHGSVNADTNTVFVNLGDLISNESGRLTVSGAVTRASIGESLLSEAVLVFEHPQTGAQESAIDYDEDEFQLAKELDVVAASVFGLGSITFLGWLAILLTILIIFLIARWLYLEREELRVANYPNNVSTRQVPMAHYQDPRNGYYVDQHGRTYTYTNGPLVDPRFDGGYRTYRK